MEKLLANCPGVVSRCVGCARFGKSFDHKRAPDSKTRLEGAWTTLMAAFEIEREVKSKNEERLTSRRVLVTDCLVGGVCDRPVMGFRLEVQAFCWTGGCLCGGASVNQSMPASSTGRNGAVAANAQCSPGWRIAATGAIGAAGKRRRCMERKRGFVE